MKKKYSYAHLIMLQASMVVVVNLNGRIAAFTARRATLTPEYIAALTQRIEAGLKLVAADTLFDQKNATLLVDQVMLQVKDLLLDFRAGIKANFRKDKARINFMMQSLGFEKYYDAVEKKSQEATVGLLFTFNENIPQFKQEIIDKGTNPQLITDICDHAKTLQNADITQESLKGVSKILTETQQQELNDIYDEVMSICTDGKFIFRNDPAQKELFSFDRIVSRLTKPAPDKTEPTGEAN